MSQDNVLSKQEIHAYKIGTPLSELTNSKTRNNHEILSGLEYYQRKLDSFSSQITSNKMLGKSIKVLSDLNIFSEELEKEAISLAGDKKLVHLAALERISRMKIRLVALHQSYNPEKPKERPSVLSIFDKIDISKFPEQKRFIEEMRKLNQEQRENFGK